ncbi:MAG TPA: glycosyltransferase [Flavobacterium sp.]|nr:glycosyltransferase [Flavobacterium sp.]
MNQKQSILICPLNWGLGHATRCVPIIKKFLDDNYKVIVATESPLTEFFKEIFPEIELEFLPGPKIIYNHKGSLIWTIFRQIPRWTIWLLREKQLIKKLNKKHRPSIIISDNRYGVRVKNTKSILITHQLTIKLPTKLQFMEVPLHKFTNQLISKFDECWVPDMETEHGLSGDLSRKYPLPKNTKFIGIQSRFMIQQPVKEIRQVVPNVDILVILSGPEPQKSILKERLIKLLHLSFYKVLIITGDPHLPANIKTEEKENITFYPHLSYHLFKRLIDETPVVISRSGYSSIMDFWYLQKNTLLIPTPGQTEQEYLAEHLKEYFSVVLQNQLDTLRLKNAISTLTNKKRIPQTLLNQSFAQ